jgi:hypothetical protein
MIEVIREVVRGFSVDEVQEIADKLPAQVVEGTYEFCGLFRLGPWFAVQIARYDISPANELYVFIAETKTADRIKEVEASGETSHATTT